MKSLKEDNKKSLINIDDVEKDIQYPITKKQKLKLKHRNLLIIIGVLLLIVLIILLIPKKGKNNNEDEQKQEITTTQKIEVKEELSIYDINNNVRPYAVMIPNDSGAKKRQHGLQNAYLVYEITVEGGITRLLALFKDVNVDKIGPVRSSRHYYLDYALENDAIYVHFGWSPQAESDIKNLNINNLNGLYNPSSMFWRDKQYSSPNNAFTSTEKIKKAINDKKYRTDSNDYALFNYKKEVNLNNDSTLNDAKNIKVNYAGNTYVRYVYDENNKYYYRFNNSNEHIDKLTNEQIHVKNILVLKMDTLNISGDDKGRQNLANIGSGDGYYITNGQSIKITWTKDKRESKTIYKNTNGEIIELNDGNTFIQIQPTSQKLVIE